MTHTTDTHTAVQFVVREARLLNEARYEEWLALFVNEGHYWVPLTGDQQPDPGQQGDHEQHGLAVQALRLVRGGPAAIA